jgi:O-antigen/teichoic acid export membrane protein
LFTLSFFRLIKRLFSTLGAILLLNLLTKPLWILAEQEVQNVLGHAAMGLYAALLGLAYALRPVADAGLAQYTTRELAADANQYSRMAGQALALKLLLGGVYILVLALVGLLVGYTGAAFQVLLVLGLFHAGLGLLELWRALLQAKQLFVLDGLASIWDKTLLVAVLAVMLTIGGLTLNAFLLANLLTMGSGVLVFGVVVWRKCGAVRPRWNAPDMRRLLRSAWPFAVVMVLFSVNERLPQFLVERLAGEHESGYFYAAFRWVATLQMYLWTVLPVFYAKFAHQRNAPLPQRQRLFNLAQVVAALPIILISGFLWFQGDRLFSLLDASTPAQVAYMHQVLRALCIMLVFNGLCNVYSTWLTATGHERWVNRFLLLAIVLGLVGYMLLVPAFGALAAGCVLAGVFVVLGTGYVWAFGRYGGLAIPWNLLAQLLLLAGGYVLCYWGAMQLQAHWLVAPTCAAALLLVCCWRLFRRLLRRV